MTPPEGAAYARCSTKSIYRAVTSGHLKAVRLADRRQIRLRREWLDSWLLGSTVVGQ